MDLVVGLSNAEDDNSLHRPHVEISLNKGNQVGQKEKLQNLIINYYLR